MICNSLITAIKYHTIYGRQHKFIEHRSIFSNNIPRAYILYIIRHILLQSLKNHPKTIPKSNTSISQTDLGITLSIRMSYNEDGVRLRQIAQTYCTSSNSKLSHISKTFSVFYCILVKHVKTTLKLSLKVILAIR